MKNTVLFLLPFVASLILIIVGILFGPEIVGSVLVGLLFFGILCVLGLIIVEEFGD